MEPPATTSFLSPTQRYAVGALFGLALHEAQVNQTRPLPLPASAEDNSVPSNDRTSSGSSSDSVSDDPDLWVHHKSGLLRSVFKFLDIDSTAWSGLEETAGSSSASHHVGPFLRLLSQEFDEGSSQRLDQELALSKAVDAIVLEMEIKLQPSKSKRDKVHEYEHQCREKFSTANVQPNSEKVDVSLETQQEADDVPLLNCEGTQHGCVNTETDERLIEEVMMLNDQRKVTVLYELLSACLSNMGEDDKGCTRKRNGYDARHRVALRLLATWLDVNWIKMELKQQGISEDKLQLLVNVTGAFRPGVLTALVGVSGAGKTTLMDVLAGRKTGGVIEGGVYISGHPKRQDTFARISGYSEQTDVHSPCLTVWESLMFSAWLRLSSDVDLETQKAFVEEIMELVELTPLSGALVGLPGVGGLSTEQRKRLTIAVELVANPSIVFMDEPTSGLDARAAAIVMRTVRNIVNTGRTIVCTIHQPSIDIFESFDELLFMKQGGELIYAGALGPKSSELISYFEAIEGVSKIRSRYNPATWMLEVTSSDEENRLGVDFAEIYRRSNLYQYNQ